MQRELGEVIFERTFERRDADENSGQVHLRVGKPQIEEAISDQLAWYCPYQIIGIGAEKVEASRGMDAIDALLVSLRTAGIILNYYGRVYRQKITWLGEEHLGLEPIRIDESLPNDDELDELDDLFNSFFRRDA